MALKRAVFLKSSAALPITGAERSMFERLSLLSNRHNWSVEIRSFAAPDERPGLCKIINKFDLALSSSEKCDRFQFHNVDSAITYIDYKSAGEICGIRFMAARIAAELGDLTGAVVLGGFRDFPILKILGDRYPNNSVTFLTEDEYPRPDELQSAKDGLEINSAIRHAPPVIVGSSFLAGSLKASWKIDASVLPVTVDIDQYVQNSPQHRRFISMLQPYTHKGIDLVLQLADAMPERTFRIPGGIGENYRRNKPAILSRHNIIHSQFIPAPQEIYNESYLVLVPSLWNEAYSRVVIEALAAGVPVIASDRGGLLDASNGGAVHLPVPPLNEADRLHPEFVEIWRGAILRFDNPEYRSLQLAAGANRIKNYRVELDQTLNRLDAMLNRLL